MESTDQYYVYLFKDPLTGEPVYVGKGKGNRAASHMWEKARTNDRLKKFLNARASQGITVEPEIIATCEESRGGPRNLNS